MSKAILFDSTLCIGCRLCETACAERNGLPYDDTIATEEKLSRHKFTAVLTRGDTFMRRLCMRCAEPTCASVGVGLGLAVSQSIVERHAGRLEVESEPGRGTKFVVTLPAELSAAVETKD